ncbi:SUKH-3 domain-containing protein, partial [Streptomyces durbertensis]
VIDPARGLHWARTLTDLGRALDTQLSPLGEEHHTTAGADEGTALLAIDAQGRVYSLDHSGDYYLGPHIDAALTTLVEGVRPIRLSCGQPAGATPDAPPE